MKGKAGGNKINSPKSQDRKPSIKGTGENRKPPESGKTPTGGPNKPKE